MPNSDWIEWENEDGSKDLFPAPEGTIHGLMLNEVALRDAWRAALRGEDGSAHYWATMEIFDDEHQDRA